MVLSNNIDALVQALHELTEKQLGAKSQGKVGVLVFCDRAERTTMPLRTSDRFKLLKSRRGEEAAFSSAEVLHKLGCETLLTWGLADGLDKNYPGGSLVLPTRVVDASAGECFDTLLAGHTKCERMVLISNEDPQDHSAKRRMAMRYQAVAADIEAATVARYAYWNDLSFAAVHAISDTEKEMWANRKPAWLHRAIKSRLPMSWRPWFVSPQNMLRRWQERHRATEQLTYAATTLVARS